MRSWGDVETYSEMIEDLNMFCMEVGAYSMAMLNGAKQCQEELEGDSSSRKAVAGVVESVKAYQEALNLANKLMKELKDEQEELIRILSKNVDNN